MKNKEREDGQPEHAEQYQVITNEHKVLWIAYVKVFASMEQWSEHESNAVLSTEYSDTSAFFLLACQGVYLACE